MSVTRILDRYITREFLKVFTLFVLAGPLLFIVADATEHVEEFQQKGMAQAEIIRLYLYKLPEFALWAFPIACLIAAVFAVNTMNRHQEITAAKAGGISFFRLTRPLLVLGFLATLGALALTEAVPVFARKRAEIEGERRSYSDYRYTFLYRGDRGREFAVRQLDVSASRLIGVVSYRAGNEVTIPSTWLTADSANWSANSGWTLRNGRIRFLTGRGVESEFRFGSARLEGFMERPELMLEKPKSTDQMRYAELHRFIDAAQRSGSPALAARVDLAQKIAIPVACLIIVLFGAPLATSANRGGTAFGIGASLVATIVYLMLFRVAGATGKSGTLPPLFAAWAPNIFFAIGAVVLRQRVRT